DAVARAQDILEAGLDPMLLEVGLHDARGRVDGGGGRVIDDPADIAGGELILRPGRATRLRDAACRGRAERGAPRVAQKTAPIDPRLANHVVLLLPAPDVQAWPPALGSHVPSPLSTPFRSNTRA